MRMGWVLAAGVVLALTGGCGVTKGTDVVTRTADAWLVAARMIGDLIVSDVLEVIAQMAAQVTLRDLQVIKVRKHFHAARINKSLDLFWA
jgi:urease alpha subunit